MSNNWPIWAVLACNGGPLLLGIVGIAYSLYLSRRLDAMMEALKNSRYIYIWGTNLRKQGWLGGMLLINKIARIAMFPKSYIRLGDFDHDDLANSPLT